MGGVLFSTFLTLVLVPVLYTMLARFTQPKKNIEELIDGEEEPLAHFQKTGDVVTARV